MPPSRPDAITSAAEPAAAVAAPDWSVRPAGGWEQVQAGRARVRARLAGQSALVRLERLWALPAYAPASGRAHLTAEP